MLRAAVFCSEIKYFGLEVTNVTSAVNSLVKASHMVTFKHNEIKKATLPYVQMAKNKEYLMDNINDYYT